MKRTLITIACLMFVVCSAQAVEPENKSDKQIGELSKKAFRYSNNKGKQSLKLITGYTGEIESQEWYKSGCENNSCNNNVAMLTSTGNAVPIAGTSLIMTFLNCPVCHIDTLYGSDYILALFDRKNTNTPLCFQHIDLVGKEKDKFYYPRIVSTIRKSVKQGYCTVVKLFGGDGMDSWSSLVFLFIDNNCKVTVLSRLYEELSLYEQEDGKSCHGKTLYYNFLNEHTVDVITEDPCIGPTENDVLKSHKKYDLKLLLKNHKTRTFKP